MSLKDAWDKIKEWQRSHEISMQLHRHLYYPENEREVVRHIMSLEDAGYTINYHTNMARRGSHVIIGISNYSPLSPDFKPSHQ